MYINVSYDNVVLSTEEGYAIIQRGFDIFVDVVGAYMIMPPL
jgi:hypothetical protein